MRKYLFSAALAGVASVVAAGGAGAVVLDYGITAEAIKKGTSPVAADNLGREAHVEQDFGDGLTTGFGTFSTLDSGGADTGIDTSARGAVLSLDVLVSGGSLSIVDNSLGFDDAAATAYLDGFSGGPAGLGVCSTKTSTDDCGSDDNITARTNLPRRPVDGQTYGVEFEVLELTFSESLTLNSIQIYDANHSTTFVPEVPQFGLGVFVGEVLNTGSDLAFCSFTDSPDPNAGLVDLSGCGLTKTFAAGDEIFFLYGGTQFYVNSIDVSEVPIPAAGLLLLSAVGGLGFAARRRRKA